MGASFILHYQDKAARSEILDRYPELAVMLEAVTALLMAHDAGLLDAAAKAHAADICAGFRLATGIIQDLDGGGLAVDTAIALALIKRTVRDAALIFPWPFTPDGQGRAVTLRQDGAAALRRLLQYDPVRDAPNGVPQYNGTAGNLAAVLRDINAVAQGVSLVEV